MLLDGVPVEKCGFDVIISVGKDYKETFPEQQLRKAKEAIEGHKPDRKFKDGVEIEKA